MATLTKSDYARRWYVANRVRVLEEKRMARIAEPERFHSYDRKEDIKRRADSNHVAERNRREREKRAARNTLLPPTHDETAFDIVTPQAAYWIGFLMGDGCIFRESVRVAVAHKDESHLQKFADFMKLDRTPSKNSKCVTVSIASKRLTSALDGFGVVPRKSMIAEVRNLEMNRDFWRGLVDANGSIFFLKDKQGYPCLNLVGSRRLMEQFQSFCASILSGRQQTIHPHKSIWSVTFGGSYAVQVIDSLYRDCEVSLDRKQQRAQQALCRRFGPNSGNPSNYQRVPTVQQEL